MGSIEAARDGTMRVKSRRRISFHRRKMPTTRLGGTDSKRGFILFRMLRRVRLKWLKMKYLRALKKLKQHYLAIVKDLKDANNHMPLLDSVFGVPILSLTVNNSASAPDRFKFTPFV